MPVELTGKGYVDGVTVCNGAKACDEYEQWVEDGEVNNYTYNFA